MPPVCTVQYLLVQQCTPAQPSTARTSCIHTPLDTTPTSPKPPYRIKSEYGVIRDIATPTIASSSSTSHWRSAPLLRSTSASTAPTGFPLRRGLRHRSSLLGTRHRFLRGRSRVDFLLRCSSTLLRFFRCRLRRHLRALRTLRRRSSTGLLGTLRHSINFLHWTLHHNLLRPPLPTHTLHSHLPRRRRPLHSHTSSFLPSRPTTLLLSFLRLLLARSFKLRLPLLH
jgi:hypothetical protein